MIRPVNFSFNEETAGDNAFQVRNEAADVQLKARQEFDDFVSLLKKNDVDVTVVEDTPEPHTPDSIFPNNWVSFHSDGTLFLYPMYAPSRRQERKENVLQRISEKFRINQKIDLSYFEKDNLFLEGTGSMILDKDNNIAYACLSPRTNETVLKEFGRKMNYERVVFTAVDKNGKQLYHTNVMMCVGDKYAVICLDCIPDDKEKQHVMETIEKTGKEIIEISYDQLIHFAGNMLQIENRKGEKLLVMSAQAYEALTEDQLQRLSQYNRILQSPLYTIETNGGGSARCMMAEIHLPLR